jgi:hypothetical protein
VRSQRIDPDALCQEARSQIGPYRALLPEFTDPELLDWRQVLVEAFRRAPRTGRIIPVRDPGPRLPHGRLLVAGFLDDVDAEIRRRLAVRAEAEHTVDAVMAHAAASGWPNARVKRFKPPTLGEIVLKMRPVPNAIVSPDRLEEIVGPADGPTAYLQWSASSLAAETAPAVLERLQKEYPNAPTQVRPISPAKRSDGSRMKANPEWRHEQRLIDAQLKRGGNRAQARARAGLRAVSRQTDFNHARWWSELNRDNPKLAQN